MNKKQINIALGCVIYEEKILLAKRNEESQIDIHNMWELPGGKVEFEESPTNTIIREINEETGCYVDKPRSLPFPYVSVRKYNDILLHIIIYCYECNFITREKDFKINDKKIKDVKWFNIKELNYLDIIPGSRDFISWIVTERYEHLLEINKFNIFQSYINFEFCDSIKNSNKFYQISILFDPTNKKEDRYSIQMFWGKIASKDKITSRNHENEYEKFSNHKIEFYKDEITTKKRLVQICNFRIKHGYKITKYTDNIPIKEWLLENKKNITLNQKEFHQLRLEINID